MPDHPGPALETYLVGFRLDLATLTPEEVTDRALLFAERCWRLEGELAAALRRIEELEGELRRAQGEGSG
jgi:hypothetical protein